MVHVQMHVNILNLEPFFKMKITFMKTIIKNSTIWTRNDSHKTACLGEKKWDDWSARIIIAIQTLTLELPDLNGCVITFIDGARETFTSSSLRNSKLMEIL